MVNYNAGFIVNPFATGNTLLRGGRVEPDTSTMHVVTRKHFFSVS